MGLFDNLSQKITDASVKRKEAKAEKKKQREQCVSIRKNQPRKC